MFLTDLILIWIFSPLGWFWWNANILDFAKGDLKQIQFHMSEAFLFFHVCMVAPFIIYFSSDANVGWLIISIAVYFLVNILLTAVSYVAHYRKDLYQPVRTPWRRPSRVDFSAL